MLNRTTRSVAPTSAGSRLHERIAPMMVEMDSAIAEAIAATGRTAGTLRINTLGMAAKKIIAPRLGRFHRAHPDVALDIVIDDGLSDIVAGRFDAGIRVGERLEKDMTAVRLTPDVKMLVVASPDYFARHGEPSTPADLHRHACINWRFPGSGESTAGSLPRKARSSRSLGGERGIRTLEGLLTLTPLAGVRLRPLGHLSAARNCLCFQRFDQPVPVARARGGHDTEGRPRRLAQADQRGVRPRGECGRSPRPSRARHRAPRACCRRPAQSRHGHHRGHPPARPRRRRAHPP